MPDGQRAGTAGRDPWSSAAGCTNIMLRLRHCIPNRTFVELRCPAYPLNALWSAKRLKPSPFNSPISHLIVTTSFQRARRAAAVCERWHKLLMNYERRSDPRPGSPAVAEPAADLHRFALADDGATVTVSFVAIFTVARLAPPRDKAIRMPRRSGPDSRHPQHRQRS